MILKEVFEHIENWAPREISWKNDNVGLQAGSPDSKLKNILLCLDVTEKVIHAAIKKECNLIISHHPLLFKQLKRLNFQSDKNSKILEKLIKNDISLYSAHTNLDFTRGGVSFELAKVLKLKNVRFLSNLKSNQCKLFVFIPENATEKVLKTIYSADSRAAGRYNHGFRIDDWESFNRPSDTKSATDIISGFKKENEIKLELLIDKWKVARLIQSIKEIHTNREITFDVYPVENSNNNYGTGAIGNLNESMDFKKFLDHVSMSLKIKNYRYTHGRSGRIKNVAVCGGAGFEFLNDAIKAGADAFITSDIKYHNFQDAEKRILLIDAGHYETEIHSLNEIKKRLKLIIKNDGNKVFKFSGSTNPVIFYNN